MQKQAGFTLIELVVVIVILGILAAFAVPRFVDLQDDARKSAVKGLAGSIRSASSLAHSKYLAAGDAAMTAISMEGQNVTLQSGYPKETGGGINKALQDYSGFTFSAGNNTDTATATFFSADGASGTCNVKYNFNNSGYPTVTVNSGGCG